MKYVLLAILTVFSLNAFADGIMTEAEAMAESQAYWDNFYKNPPAPETAKEYHRKCIEFLGPVEEQHVYYGSGVELSDKDIYIDGKKYHCIEYEMNTQCHID